MIRTFYAVLFIALIAPPLLAEETAVPRFFIEHIVVRNAHRVSPDVITSESLLREGHDYSEAELHDASLRLSRLPFLLSAEFSLEKGTERGRHVLVITINETKPFFFSLDGRPIMTGDTRTRVDYSDRSTGTDSEGVVGMRFFVGRRGAVHVGLYAEDFQHDFANDYLAFAVGYTQYDLFGTRAFATLNLKRVVGGYGSLSLSPQLVVGVPLSTNQTVTLSVDETDFGTELRRIGATEEARVSSAQRLVSATWAYNTTNHPFFPTRGTLLQVKPFIGWNDRAGYEFDRDLTFRAYTAHSRVLVTEVAGARYWEISDRDSVSAGLMGGVASFDIRSDCRTCGKSEKTREYGIVHGGFSHSLWDPNRAKDGDSRLEVNLRIGKSLNEPIDHFHNEINEQLSASWVRRSSWGTLRLGAGYAW